MITRGILLGGLATLLAACSGGSKDDNQGIDTGSAMQAASTCGIDVCENAHGAGTMGSFLGVQAFSNGLCTGSGSGGLAYQCVDFAKDVLRAYSNRLTDDTWGCASRGLGKAQQYRDDGNRDSNGDFLGTLTLFGPAIDANGNVRELMSSSDDMRTSDPPMEGDVLIYWRSNAAGLFRPQPDGEECGRLTGHVAVVASTEDTSSGRTIRIREQNMLLDTQCNGKGAEVDVREETLARNKDGTYTVGSTSVGSKYRLAGWIRHDRAGVRAPTTADPQTWKRGISNAFREAYHAYGTASMGWPHDNGGGQYMHDAYGLTVQDYRQPCAEWESTKCTEGHSILILAPQDRDGGFEAYRLALGFRQWYLDPKNKGWSQLQRPLGREITYYDTSGTQHACQAFELGYLHWKNGKKVEMVGESPDPICKRPAKYDAPYKVAEAPDVTTSPSNDFGGGSDDCADGTCVIPTDEPEQPVNNTAPPAPSTPVSSSPALVQPEPTISAGNVTCIVGEHRCIDAIRTQDCGVDVYGNPYWSQGECNPGFACESSSGQCMAQGSSPPPSTPAPAPAPTPAPSPVPTPTGPIGTISCQLMGPDMAVTITGDISHGLNSAAPAGTAFLEYGSDSDGWSNYTSGKPMLTWNRNFSSHMFYIGTNVNGMNFFLYDPASGSASWFQLDKWNVTGDCYRSGSKVYH